MGKKINKESKLVKCPFFKGQDMQKIWCEGVQPDSSIILSFGTREGKRAYRLRYCDKAHRLCRIYRLNDSKYDEEGYLK